MTDAFLDPAHRALVESVRAFAAAQVRHGAEDESNPGERTVQLAAMMARDGILSYTVPPPHGRMDLRSLVVVREALAYESSLADTAFVMQGLGSHPVALAGNDGQKERWFPGLTSGEHLAAFAVTEPQAGSDLGAIATRAVRYGSGYRLAGDKVFISNAGIARLYTVLARTSGDGTKGLSMFLVDAAAGGLSVEPQTPTAPHPLGRVRFEGAPGQLLGAEGQGHEIALRTLDTFRPSVGAAACGLAQRALDEAVAWCRNRTQFGKPLADFQATRLALADMRVSIDAARLLVYRAAWLRDRGAERITLEGSEAKLFATEMAQQVVDRAVQLHGGTGVMRGSTVERLYREVRALRIYEGTSEIQKLVIARELLRGPR